MFSLVPFWFSFDALVAFGNLLMFLLLLTPFSLLFLPATNLVDRSLAWVACCMLIVFSRTLHHFHNYNVYHVCIFLSIILCWYRILGGILICSKIPNVWDITATRRLIIKRKQRSYSECGCSLLDMRLLLDMDVRLWT